MIIVALEKLETTTFTRSERWRLFQDQGGPTNILLEKAQSAARMDFDRFSSPLLGVT